MSGRVTALAGSPMVSFTDVSRRYGNVVACSEVSVDIGPGVTALLGPNGAGKSTLLRLCCGLTRPSEGVVRIHGHDPRAERRVFRFVGIVPQHQRLFPRMTALRFVSLAGTLGEVDDPIGAARSSLDAVDLDPDDPRILEHYSNGMRQRVKIAQALVTGPSIIVADEPLNGLDPGQRVRMIETLRRLGEQGRAVIISSHVLDEVERFDSRVLVMTQGRLAAEGSVAGIRDLMDDRPHRIRLVVDHAERLGSQLLVEQLVSEIIVNDQRSLDIATENVAALARRIAPMATELGVLIEEIRPLDDDLDSVFRYLVDGR